MPHPLVTRSVADIEAIRALGDHRDSRKAAWKAVRQGSEVIRDIQRLARRRRTWTTLKKAEPLLDAHARTLLKMRLEALGRLKQAPHHQDGFRLSAATGARAPRAVNALCLISGYEGQEIPGLVAFDRVVVDVEHMEQALGPASITEIVNVRRAIGEYVYISTNVSETPQLVRDPASGALDTRSTAALTASKVIAALQAGADIVKVGFAHMDEFKRDLRSEEVVRQMVRVRAEVDQAVRQGVLVWPLNRTQRYPLVSVFFPEIGIDSRGERPAEIGQKAIELTARGGWQGVLIDTFEKRTGRRYVDFYSYEDTTRLMRLAHARGLEYWVAGSISLREVAPLLACKVDLICFGGAARHRTGVRTVLVHGQPDQTIKRPLVEKLVRAFERGDPRDRARQRVRR